MAIRAFIAAGRRDHEPVRYETPRGTFSRRRRKLVLRAGILAIALAAFTPAPVQAETSPAPQPPTMRLLRVVPMTPGGNNPLDFRDLRNDIEAVGAVIAAVPQPIPLTLLTGLPFAGVILEIEIDGVGTDTLRAKAWAGNTATTTLVISPVGNPAAANIDPGPSYQVTSRTAANPVPEGATESFVLRRTATGQYYKLNLRIDVNNITFFPTLMSLTGFRCGTSASYCP